MGRMIVTVAVMRMVVMCVIGMSVIVSRGMPVIVGVRRAHRATLAKERHEDQAPGIE
jgi:hypothetical protein